MEPNQPRDQNHRGDVEHLVGKRPAERPENQLQAVGDRADRVCRSDPRSSQNRYVEYLCEIVTIHEMVTFRSKYTRGLRPDPSPAAAEGPWRRSVLDPRERHGASAAARGCGAHASIRPSFRAATICSQPLRCFT